MTFWQTFILASIPVLGTVGGGIWVYLSSKGNTKANKEGTFLEQLFKYMSVQDSRISNVENKANSLETQVRLLGDYANELRAWISAGKPPPPPDWPSGLVGDR